MILTTKVTKKHEVTHVNMNAKNMTDQPMRKTRVYLDNCCFNRPYDDLNNINVQLEAEAKFFIQQQVLLGTLELAWSYMMDKEIYDTTGHNH